MTRTRFLTSPGGLITRRALPIAFAVIMCSPMPTSSTVAASTSDAVIEQSASASAIAVRVSPPADVDEFREFDVEGVAVVTRSALRELPERASVISFSGTLIDAGSGLEWCFGGVLESLPPQCGGPVVSGLSAGSWSTTISGVTFGERSVHTTWPPIDGTIDRLADGPADSVTGEQPFDVGFPFPVDCEQIENLVSVRDLARYAAQNMDRTASAYISRNDVGLERGVLQVSGDLTEVRADLTIDGLAPCLVAVRYSRSELAAAQAKLGPLFDADIGLAGTGSGNVRNRVEVDVAVADVVTIRAVVEAIDDPGILFVTGNAAIVAGR